MAGKISRFLVLHLCFSMRRKETPHQSSCRFIWAFVISYLFSTNDQALLYLHILLEDIFCSILHAALEYPYIVLPLIRAFFDILLFLFL